MLAHDHPGGPDSLISVGILCELGDRLEYRQASDTFHNDGTYAAYRRHFVGSLPFAVLAPDRGLVATALDIRTFEVKLTRRDAGTEDWTDVTEELHDAIGDRAAELLAIVVNHRLSGQNLDAGSHEFEERSQRLKRLRVRQVSNLVLDAHAVGTDLRVVLGEGSDQDVFLDGPTSVAPILWHDFDGEGWHDRLRRKLAAHLAALLQNPAYTATFALFLIAETDTERAEVLQDLGVSSDEVEIIKFRIGAVTADDVQRDLRWFKAIVQCLGGPAELVDANEPLGALLASGLTPTVAARLAELGGGVDVRESPEVDGALQLLAKMLNLAELDRRLRAEGDPGLFIRVAPTMLDRWRSVHGRHVAAVLARRGATPGDAKAAPGTWSAPPGLKFALEIAPIDILTPVLNSLRSTRARSRPGPHGRRPDGGAGSPRWCRRRGRAGRPRGAALRPRGTSPSIAKPGRRLAQRVAPPWRPSQVWGGRWPCDHQGPCRGHGDAAGPQPDVAQRARVRRLAPC